jgi:phage baseplate assembly protein V
MRVAGAVLRGFITATDEAKRLRQVWTSLRWGEDTEAFEHVEPYGFTARPFAGAEAVAVRVGAAADHTIILCTPDGRYRIKTLAEGEVALYDDRGSVVRLGRDGIHVSATGVCNVTASGNCTVNGAKVLFGGATGDPSEAVLYGSPGSPTPSTKVFTGA